MLSDEDKKRIRAEEIFRREVQADLCAAKSLKGNFWHALNTPFVLWILSSVVIGILGWAYTTYQTARAVRLKSEETARKIHVEIACRVDSGARSLAALARGIENRNEKFTEADIFIQAQDALNGKGIDVVYPEYSTRSFRSLFIELVSQSGDSDRQHLKECLRAYLELGSNRDGKLKLFAAQPPTDADKRVMMNWVSEASDLLHKCNVFEFTTLSPVREQPAARLDEPSLESASQPAEDR